MILNFVQYTSSVLLLKFYTKKKKKIKRNFFLFTFLFIFNYEPSSNELVILSHVLTRKSAAFMTLSYSKVEIKSKTEWRTCARATRKEVYFIRFTVEFLQELRRISLHFNFSTNPVPLHKMREFTREISFRWFRDAPTRIVVLQDAGAVHLQYILLMVLRSYFLLSFILIPLALALLLRQPPPNHRQSRWQRAISSPKSLEFMYHGIRNYCWWLRAPRTTTLSRAPEQNEGVLLSIYLFLLPFSLLSQYLRRYLRSWGHWKFIDILGSVKHPSYSTFTSLMRPIKDISR